MRSSRCSLCNADLRKDQQNDEILRFVEFWKARTGSLPQELIFTASSPRTGT